MKRLIVIVIALGVFTSTALAQQSSQSEAQIAEIKARLLNASNPGSSTPDYFRIQNNRNPFSRSDVVRVDNTAILVEPPVYVKDGKVYISFDSLGVLIPMTGGGGDACFKLDLKERIEALKNLIVRFPL